MNTTNVRIYFILVTPILPLIQNLAVHMDLPFVSPPPLMVDLSDAWFLYRSADIKWLMITYTVYDIVVVHGKDHPDTPCALNGLNL
jgi:hypothetical protein